MCVLFLPFYGPKKIFFFYANKYLVFWGHLALASFYTFVFSHILFIYMLTQPKTHPIQKTNSKTPKSIAIFIYRQASRLFPFINRKYALKRQNFPFFNVSITTTHFPHSQFSIVILLAVHITYHFLFVIFDTHKTLLIIWPNNKQIHKLDPIWQNLIVVKGRLKSNK